jgi:ATP-binding cassette, subfamily B, bacterial PglK
MINSLWKSLPYKRKREFWRLLLLMVLGSISEIISIGLIIPFLAILTAPEELYNLPIMQPIIQYFELTQSAQLIFPITMIFISVAILAGIIRLSLLYMMTRLSYETGVDLGLNIYKNTLSQKYEKHLMLNSSDVINNIVNKTNIVIGGVLTPVLMLISSFIMFIGITTALFLINIKIALSIIISFGVIYYLIMRFTGKKLRENSDNVATQSTVVIKSLQEGLGGIRDVIINNSQQFYCDLYHKADSLSRRASGSNVFISGSPRPILESLGMVLIATIAFLMYKDQESDSALVVPVLGALALGAQRLLPTVQQIYSSISTIKGSNSSFKDILELLLLKSYDLNKSKKINFKTSIKLRDVNYRYAKGLPYVLNDVNFTIEKGDLIGFVGATGSGKSTLIDILIGLLAPTKGGLLIDNVLIKEENRNSWQSHISHVPQKVYLSDCSIEENIAFGVSKEKIDYIKLDKAAKDAQITKLIQNLEYGYKTVVGEQGVKLSGGQIQRIGIARALYRDADVLIMDEATSALDDKTEKDVMQAINNKNMTILIIAHRLNTLKNCNKIVKIQENGTIKLTTYNSIIGKKYTTD